MTNRKIKNAQRNMLMKRILDTNVELLLGTMVCLNRQGIGRRRISDVLEEYRAETVPYWEKFAKEDRQDVEVRKALAAINLDFNLIVSTINTTINEKPEIVERLAENLGILCLQINYSFGYGKERLTRLLSELVEYRRKGGRAVEDAKRLFEVEFEDDKDELPDVDALRWHKPRIGYAEAMRYRREMEAVRMIQEGTNGQI